MEEVHKLKIFLCVMPLPILSHPLNKAPIFMGNDSVFVIQIAICLRKYSKQIAYTGLFIEESLSP